MKMQDREFGLECSSLQQGSQSVLRSTEAAPGATGALCQTFHVLFSVEMTLITVHDRCAYHLLVQNAARFVHTLNS